MKLTKTQYLVMIQKAEEAGACSQVLDILNDLTPKQVLADERAPYWACWYAYKILNGPWPEAEDVIRTSPKWDCWYAHNVLNGPWPETQKEVERR